MPTGKKFARKGDESANVRVTSSFIVRSRATRRRKAAAETSGCMKPTQDLSPQSISASLRLAPSKCLPSPGHIIPVDHFRGAGEPIESGGERHVALDTHTENALAAAIDQIREQWRRRQMWHRAEKSLTLQAKSMCRRLLQGDKKEADVLYKAALNGKDQALAETAVFAMAPLLRGRDGIERERKVVERELLLLAAELPVAGWIGGVRGVGLLSLVGIVGEAGDLSAYSNPAKLWKRMGLAVIGGERQRKKEGAAGIEHGYNPARRSLMWTVGDCIIRAGGPLKELYNERKVYETPRVKTKMHAHNRAKRYIEKRLLRDLWRAWRNANSLMQPTLRLRSSEVSTEEAP